MRRLVIFDLDATLVDSISVARRSFVDAFVACGQPGVAPAEEFIALSGMPLAQVCDVLGLPSSFPSRFRSASRELQGELTLFPGIHELLESLHAAGIPLAIITGKDRPRTLETLGLFGLSHFFRAVVTPDDEPEPKPSPDGVLWICRLVGVAAPDSIVVGDSLLDMQASRASGALTVGCSWGVAQREALYTEGAGFVADSVDELADFLYRACGVSRSS